MGFHKRYRGVPTASLKTFSLVKGVLRKAAVCFTKRILKPGHPDPYML